MTFSMTGQEKGELLIPGDCIIEVITWAGLTVIIIKAKVLFLQA